MSFLLIYAVYQLYNCWNSPQYRTNFQYCFWVATRYVCSWVKQRIYNKYLKNSQLFTSKSSQSSLISFTHGLFNLPLSRSTQQLQANVVWMYIEIKGGSIFFRRGVHLLKMGPNWRIPEGNEQNKGVRGHAPPPPKCLEILIANGAFWINLDHELRAKISPILFVMFHAFTSRILELLNRFIVIKSLTIEFSYIRVYCLNTPPPPPTYYYVVEP